MNSNTGTPYQSQLEGSDHPGAFLLHRAQGDILNGRTTVACGFKWPHYCGVRLHCYCYCCVLPHSFVLPNNSLFSFKVPRIVLSRHESCIDTSACYDEFAVIISKL